MDKKRPRVGTPQAVSTACELAISDYLQAMDPPRYFRHPKPGAPGMEAIDPSSYFVTSGDAIQKTKYLEPILWQYASAARRHILRATSKVAEDIEFEEKCWAQAGRCRSLRYALIKARGDAVFLETEWIGHVLICVPKNPRSVKAVKAVKAVKVKAAK